MPLYREGQQQPLDLLKQSISALGLGDYLKHGRVNFGLQP